MDAMVIDQAHYEGQRLLKAASGGDLETASAILRNRICIDGENTLTYKVDAMQIKAMDNNNTDIVNLLCSYPSFVIPPRYNTRLEDYRHYNGVDHTHFLRHFASAKKWLNTETPILKVIITSEIIPMLYGNKLDTKKVIDDMKTLEQDKQRVLQEQKQDRKKTSWSWVWVWAKVASVFSVDKNDSLNAKKKDPTYGSYTTNQNPQHVNRPQHHLIPLEPFIH